MFVGYKTKAKNAYSSLVTVSVPVGGSGEELRERERLLLRNFCLRDVCLLLMVANEYHTFDLFDSLPSIAGDRKGG